MGTVRKWLLHAAGGAWSRCAWCQTALCVLSCSVISLNKRAQSARVVLWRLALSPQTEPGPCRCYLHPPNPHPYQNSFFFFFCLSNSNSKVTLCYIYLAGAAERKENAFKRLGFAPEEGTVKQEEREREKKNTSQAHLHARVVKHFCCILTFTKWRRGWEHLHFQIVVMRIDSQTNMIQNELCQRGRQ